MEYFDIKSLVDLIDSFCYFYYSSTITIKKKLDLLKLKLLKIVYVPMYNVRSYNSLAIWPLSNKTLKVLKYFTKTSYRVHNTVRNLCDGHVFLNSSEN